MEAGLASDQVAVVVESDALGSEDGVEIGEGLEVLVDDRLVDMGPEGLGRLQLGGVGREIDEADAVGHREAGLGVPAGAVEHEEDDAVAAGPGLAGEEREDVLEKRLVDAARYQKLSPVAGETKAMT